MSGFSGLELAGSSVVRRDICPAEAFECLMCGRCCEGSGGIILTGHDLQRISACLKLTPETFTAEFSESVNGKLRIRSGADGFCVFYSAGRGCSVHPGRPDICRAWPFFKGNLVDRTSLAMAAEDCPGINKRVSFEEFKAQGLRYLEKHGLMAGDDPHAPNALKIKI